MICDYYGDDHTFTDNLGIALHGNPAVVWYFKHKCPECIKFIDEILNTSEKANDIEKTRASEIEVIQTLETTIVYVYPELMNQQCDYIVDWEKDKLLNLVDFEDKLVLDVGSGTGRLSFAASETARRVYASEPTGSLRDYMRHKIIKENINNVTVVDGTVESIPYEDDTFDIVMSGHVVGDDYDVELAEMTRVVKNGGYIVDCIGDDNRKRIENQELIKRGFTSYYHVSKSGGDIYRYVKKVKK